MPSHPDAERLMAYHDGDLDPTARRAVEAHLVGCASCRHEVEETSALDGALHRCEPPDPGAAYWATFASRVWQRLGGTEQAPRAGWLERVAAWFVPGDRVAWVRLAGTSVALTLVAWWGLRGFAPGTDTLPPDGARVPGSEAAPPPEVATREPALAAPGSPQDPRAAVGSPGREAAPAPLRLAEEPRATSEPGARRDGGLSQEVVPRGRRLAQEAAPVVVVTFSHAVWQGDTLAVASLLPDVERGLPDPGDRDRLRAAWRAWYQALRAPAGAASRTPRPALDRQLVLRSDQAPGPPWPVRLAFLDAALWPRRATLEGRQALEAAVSLLQESAAAQPEVATTLRRYLAYLVRTAPDGGERRRWEEALQTLEP